MRAVAVIIKDGLILLIHRFFKNKEYFVLPGGGVEKGESVEGATIREVKEETSLDAKIGKKLWEFYNDYDKRIHHYFLVTDFSGDLMLGGEEAETNSPSDSYVLEWHKLTELPDLPLKPEIIKEKLTEKFI